MLIGTQVGGQVRQEKRRGEERRDDSIQCGALLSVKHHIVPFALRIPS